MNYNTNTVINIASVESNIGEVRGCGRQQRLSDGFVDYNRTANGNVDSRANNGGADNHLAGDVDAANGGLGGKVNA